MLLLRLLEANLDGTELTYDQLELAELVQRGLTKETCRKAAEAVLERCRAANAKTLRKSLVLPPQTLRTPRRGRCAPH